MNFIHRTTLTLVKLFRNIIACYFIYATISISSLLLVSMNMLEFKKISFKCAFIKKHESTSLIQCINGSKPLDAMQPAVCLNVVMMWLFIYCFFGDQLTNQFESLGPTVYQCNWYFWRLDFLRVLPFTILATQKLIHMRGFGNSSCTRETFKKVRKIFI